MPEERAQQVEQAPERAPVPLVAHAVRSSVWSVLGQFAQFSIGLISAALMTRWVAPAEYGLVAMAGVLSGVLSVVGDAGVSTALMTRKTVDSSGEATGFWLSLGGGVVLAAVCAAPAPILAGYYHEPRITALAVALALGFVVAAPGRVPLALLIKEMRFASWSMINVASSAVGLACGIGLAIRGVGAWSLVAQNLVAFGSQSLLGVLVRPFTVRPSKVSLRTARELATFGSQVSSYSLANTVARVFDNLLGGRWVGPAGLGLMSIAIRVFVTPIGRLCCVVSNVFLPTLVSLSDGAARARAFTGVVRITALVTFPISVGTAAIAGEIETLFPARWAGLAGPLRVFGAGSLVDAVSWYAIAVLLASGRARSLMLMAIALVPASWIAVVIGASRGTANGLAAGWVVWNVLQAAVATYLVSREFPLGREFWAGMLRPLIAAGIMGAIVRVLLTVTHLDGSSTGAVLGAGVGALAYSALALTMMRSDVMRLMSLLGSAWLGRKAAHAEHQNR